MAKHSLQEWVIATRPWSFTASGLTVVVVLAYLNWIFGDIINIDWFNGLWAVLAIVLFHAAGNTWSDWHDYRRGVDAADTHGVDTLTSGKFSPSEIRNFAIGLYIVAAVVGLGLVFRTGLPLLWIGIGGLLCAVLYPPLKYRAMGDVVILTAYGLLPAIGTSYVAIGRIEWVVMFVAFPVALLVDSILHANNTRDMHTDRRASVSTMAQGLGVRGAVVLYFCEQLIPFVWVAALWVFGFFPVYSLAVLGLLPVALRNCRTMRAYKKEADANAIASLDQQSAQLQLLYCVVMTLTFFLDKWLR